MNSKQRIFITGIAGFVGSRLAKRLAGDGYGVCGVEYARTQRCDDLERAGIAVKVADVCDRDAMVSLLNECRPDFVINCASQQPRKGMGFDQYYRGNVKTLDTLCDAMRETGVSRIVTFSSATVYGDGASGVLDENSPIAPSNYYAISKWVAERIALTRAKMDNMGGVCFRMPSVFGAGQGGGIVDTYYSALRVGERLEIFSKGELIRNIIHVDDVVEACVQAVKGSENLSEMEVVLLGSCDSLPMGEIARIMADRMRVSSKIVCVDTPAPVNANWDLCIDRLREKLGFTPMSIGEGVDRYLAEMSGNENAG